MRNHELHTLASSVPIRPRAGYFKLGLWIRVGIASVWATLAGLAMLADAKLGVPAYGALATVIGGAAVGVFSWRQVRALDDTPDASTSGIAAAKPVAQGGKGARRPRASQLRILSLLQR